MMLLFVSHRLPIALKVLEEGGSVKLFVGMNLTIIETEAINKLKNHNIRMPQMQFFARF